VAAPASSPAIRGGGEFGTRWHDAGRFAGKRLAHDDFAAVAADLVRRGVTRAGRIAAEGGSNGGILISKYADALSRTLRGAVLHDSADRHAPLLKLLAGASWIAEYGDPDKRKEWAWLQTYSAYHAAQPGRNIRRSCSRRRGGTIACIPDTRAKWRPSCRPWATTLVFTTAAGGHGIWQGQQGARDVRALGYAFLKDRIGWSDTGRKTLRGPVRVIGVRKTTIRLFAGISKVSVDSKPTLSPKRPHIGDVAHAPSGLLSAAGIEQPHC